MVCDALCPIIPGIFGTESGASDRTYLGAPEVPAPPSGPAVPGDPATTNRLGTLHPGGVWNEFVDAREAAGSLDIEHRPTQPGASGSLFAPAFTKVAAAPRGRLVSVSEVGGVGARAGLAGAGRPQPLRSLLAGTVAATGDAGGAGTGALAGGNGRGGELLTRKQRRRYAGGKYMPPPKGLGGVMKKSKKGGGNRYCRRGAREGDEG